MSTLPPGAVLCHRCGGYYFRISCPKCFPQMGNTMAANAGDYGTAELPHGSSQSGSGDTDKGQPVQKLRHRRGKMNKTERAMSYRLAEFAVPFYFEGITLRWAGTEDDAPMRYTPDFVVFTEPKWTLIEAKGAHERSRDIVRFRGCRAEWQHRFNFEYWQLKKGAWTRLE